MEDRFSIKTTNFEGPLELLLDLIERRKLHISEISLAQVTDDYISHIKAMQDAQMGNMATFILIASTLILIKSSSLLPNLTLTEEEKSSVNDLEYRLKMLQFFRDLSLHVKQRFGEKMIFQSELARTVEPVFSPTEEIKLNTLREAIMSVITALPKKEVIPQAVIKKVVSLEEVITNLTKRVQSSLRLRFSEFAADKKDRVNVIVSFLGMLELVKEGIIEAKQDMLFSDIDMETRSPSVPRIL